MDKMKTALFVIWQDTHFTELIRIARLLKSSEKYTPVILFYWDYPVREKDLKICKDEEIYTIDSNGNSLNSIMESNKLCSSEKDSHFFLNKVIKYLISFFPNFVDTLLFEVQKIKKIKRIFRDLTPGILILAEDNVNYDSASFIKVAHFFGISSIIFPYTISNALEPAEALFRIPEYNFKYRSNKIAGRLFPKWILKYRGHSLVRLPASRIILTELFRRSPPHPWIMNSGAVDKIAVESNFMLKYYLKEGFPRSQIALTGALYNDILYSVLRDAAEQKKVLYEELDLSPNRNLIVSALPPDNHMHSKEQVDFKSYPDLIEFWVKSLANLPNCNIVIRLHPRLKYEEMKYIEQWGVKISQRDTAELIPLCDIFVASISATIRWAIACGKPVVNYDVYRLRFNDYDNAGGVITIEEQHDFKIILNRLVMDKAYYNELEQRQKSCMHEWGVLHGNAATTILQTIDATIKQNQRGIK